MKRLNNKIRIPLLALLAILGILEFAGQIARPAIAATLDTTPGNIVYVTDELRLGLYQTEETSGRSLKTLISGSRLEILERSLMSIRVRTEAGDEGWVKTAYIVKTEPARRRLASLESLQTETADALATQQAEVGRLNGQVETLAEKLLETEQGVQDLPAIRAENEALKQTLATEGLQIPLPWVLVATVVALITGAVVGYWWLDRRVRRNFGGLRVY